jgi:transglutaminase 1
MQDERERREYVLNETGKIFVGSHKQVKGRRWVYGQFDGSVLPACVFALELAKLAAADRANPVKVVRAVSAIVS